MFSGFSVRSLESIIMIVLTFLWHSSDTDFLTTLFLTKLLSLLNSIGIVSNLKISNLLISYFKLDTSALLQILI